MSNAIEPLIDEVLRAGRELGAETIFFHEAVAGALRLAATEMKVVDLLMQAEGGALTPGELARSTSVTTGGMSQILDRLEGARLIQRIRDDADRRRVIVRVDERGIEAAQPLYDGLERRIRTMLEGRSASELKVIRTFLAQSSAALAEARQEVATDR